VRPEGQGERIVIVLDADGVLEVYRQSGPSWLNRDSGLIPRRGEDLEWHRYPGCHPDAYRSEPVARSSGCGFAMQSDAA
jgi:hypothetical protein